MGAIFNGICSFFRGLKTWLMISDWLRRIEDHMKNIEEHGEIQDTNLELFRNHMQTLNNRICSIDEYGSKGVQKGFAVVETKIDNLDNKIDETKQDVAKIKGFLKMNGFPVQHAADAEYEEHAKERDLKADIREDKAAKREERAIKRDKTSE